MILLGTVCFTYCMKAACFMELSEAQAECEGASRRDT